MNNEDEYPLSFDEIENEAGVYQIDEATHDRSWCENRPNDILYVVIIEQRGSNVNIPLAVSIDGNSFKPRDIRNIDVFSNLRYSSSRFKKLDYVEFTMVFSLKEKKDD